MNVADLTGRHRVRVVIDGVEGSPLDLGVLQLDRQAPTVSSVSLTPAGGTITADWILADDLSGSDPAEAPVAEVNASPAGDGSGAWVAFASGPGPGDGRKTAVTSLAGLPDGRHLVRVRARDRAGNVAVIPVGAVLADHTPPSLSDVRLVRAVTSATALAQIAFRADDGAGVGLVGGRVRVAPPGAGEGVDWSQPGAPGPGSVMVRPPGPGVHVVVVHVSDALGNRATSGPVTIRVPTVAQVADAAVPDGPAVSRGAAEAAGPGVSRAFARVRALHRARGVNVRGGVGVARTAASWRRLLGTPAAARYTGYATLRGGVLLGPAAAASLEELHRAARIRPVRPLGRAAADRAAFGLAVLLHETLHDSGAQARDDVLGTISGRALEEGLTEAATVVLLPRFVRALGLPPPVRASVLGGVRRYRLAYPGQVAWVLRLSRRATGAPAGSARARAWRVRAADAWGPERWSRLAAATGTAEAVLRGEAALAAGVRPRAAGGASPTG